MSTTDKHIADVLARFDEPFAGNVWRVQGNAVIYHKTLERIATKAGIKWDSPEVLLSERDACAILVAGSLDGKIEWSVGEAIVGVNYRVSGKQAAYPYAMAEKRGKDRVILKLIELHGLVYSEDESEEFGESRPLSTGSTGSSDSRPASGTPEEPSEPTTATTSPNGAATSSTARQTQPGTGLKPIENKGDFERRVGEIKTPSVLHDFINRREVGDWLASLHPRIADRCRDYARERYREISPRREAAE